MGHPTRRATLAGLAAATLAPRVAQAAWPDRPISLVHVFAPGGGADVTARIVGEALATRLGQPVLVESKAGAGSTLAAAQVAEGELEEALRQQKGKVVVMDLWGDFCIPCKKEFPHLIELHHKYAKDGMTAVSLSLDPVEDKGKALKFLQEKNAAFPNYLLDEDAKIWQEHFDIYGQPAVMVYGTDGKLAGRFDHNDANKQYTYDDVEKLVQKLLKAK